MGFALLSPITFLTLLSSSPTITATGLELCQTDADIFKSFTKDSEKLQRVIKLFNKCRAKDDID
ncbi:hypothetical protein BDZ94DRAFT_1316620 [Collybia nuda]|uniref:Uncharacterized protein n=1 Tax=Collybia nuda TaxID=64659 RepID=A0A9P5XSV6_9AGAR|nr:hypothetical protein BDZ94DRAFT_1316620 [Collybia nuda]